MILTLVAHVTIGQITVYVDRLTCTWYGVGFGLQWRTRLYGQWDAQTRYIGRTIFTL